MKPTLPPPSLFLFLFLFLTLTAAFPLPFPFQGHETCTRHGTCTSSSGRPTFTSIASLWHFSSRNPGSLLPNSLSFDAPQANKDARIPSNPSHSVDQPSSPTDDDASQALSSNSPLSSTYLLSLDTKVSGSYGGPKDSERMRASGDDMEGAPDPAQPYYGREDAMKAESTSGMDSEREQMGHAVFEEAFVDSAGGKGNQKFYRDRECSDVIVVAIVLLFLVVVMVVEVLEGVVRSVKTFFNIGEGQIKLEQVAEKPIASPFQLQPAPRTREFMGVKVVGGAA